MMGYGLFFWMPSFIVRSHGLTLLEASLFFGAILLFGGMAGMWAGGWLGDRLGQLKKTRYVTVPALAFLMQSNRREARGIKVRQWLLMALRMLVIALLAFSLAHRRPVRGDVLEVLGPAVAGDLDELVDVDARLGHHPIMSRAQRAWITCCWRLAFAKQPAP